LVGFSWSRSHGLSFLCTPTNISILLTLRTVGHLRNSSVESPFNLHRTPIRPNDESILADRHSNTKLYSIKALTKN
jgi:hypothetical protein